MVDYSTFSDERLLTTYADTVRQQALTPLREEAWELSGEITAINAEIKRRMA